MPSPSLPQLKALPPLGRRLCADIRRFLRDMLELDVREKRLLLAVSGGADSLALLLLFAALRERMGHTLCVAHIDHGLRPESAAEAALVAQQCATWGIPCVLRRIPVAEHARRHAIGLEEAGRALRYAALEEERRRAGAVWICTGHHGDDLQEDILMRLMRGTGWPGLGGMPAYDAQRFLCRPLLLTAAKDLRDLLTLCGIAWVEDASNADLRYTRNRMRHTLLPLLREDSPALGAHLRQLWRMARDDEAHWNTELERLLDAHGLPRQGVLSCLPAALLRQCDRATRMRLYMRALRSLHCGQGRASTLFELDAAWEAGRGGTAFQLPGGVTAHLRQRTVHFSLAHSE